MSICRPVEPGVGSALKGDRMKAICLVLLLVTFATPGLAAGGLTKLCILKAKDNLPAVAGIQIKTSRARPMPADQLANWKGQSKPIIVDIETVANGHGEMYSYVCASSPSGRPFVQRIKGLQLHFRLIAPADAEPETRRTGGGQRHCISTVRDRHESVDPPPATTLAARCSEPQRIDNLHQVAGRGIICDGFAATAVSTDKQIPTWRPGRMARRRSRNLQHPVLGRQMRSTHGRYPVGHPAPASTLLDDRLAPRLQAMWHRRFWEHRADPA